MGKRISRRSGTRYLVAGLVIVVGSVDAAGQEMAGADSLERAAACFAELEAACEKDDAHLWGVRVCGPVLLVDPATRSVVGNVADKEGLLERRANVFVGRLPPDKLIGNATLSWGGVKWAMVVIMFLGETPEERVTLLAHESFHCVQPELGLFAPGEINDHLDTADGRYWMQLEWNALQAALGSDGPERRAAVEDALAFRATRRALYPPAAARENRQEIHEGLAQYTGLRIAERTPKEVVEFGAARRAREEGFVRSFAYVSGPLYGYLLDAADDGWRKRVTADSDLGSMLAEALNAGVHPERAPRAAARHGGEALREAEDARARAREERLAAWRRSLIDGPVLVLDLSGKITGSFDTRHTHVLDDGRIVYTKRTIIAEWGRLECDGAPMLQDTRTRRAHLALVDAAPDHLSGPGWTVRLNEGWSLAPGTRAGDLEVRRSR